MTHRYLIRFVVKNSSFYGSLGDQCMTSKNFSLILIFANNGKEGLMIFVGICHVDDTQNLKLRINM